MIKTTRSNLRCNDTKFILASVERDVVDTCKKLGFSTGTIRSINSKELPILKEDKVVAYISRSVGLGKGLFSIVIHPGIAASMDAKIKEIASIRANPNKKKLSRFISSSNYRGFNSIGYCESLESNEHAAAGYTIDSEKHLEALKSFLLTLGKTV